MPPRMQWVQRPGLQLRMFALAIVLAAVPGWAQSNPIDDARTANVAASCAAWPGEPAPLPTVAESDPFLRAWAEARSGELGRLARALEGLDRVEARRFWEHALCIAPADARAREGLARATPPAVHRPEPTTRSALASGEPGPSVSLQAALAVALSEPTSTQPEPIRLAAISPATSTATEAATPVRVPDSVAAEPDREETAEASAVSAPPPAPPRFDHADAVAALLQQARFRHALERAEDARSELREDRGGEARQQLAQVEVLAATAEVALGNPSAAEQHFRSALDADPELELDASHPPKVQRIFESAREARP